MLYGAACVFLKKTEYLLNEGWGDRNPALQLAETQSSHVKAVLERVLALLDSKTLFRSGFPRDHSVRQKCREVEKILVDKALPLVRRMGERLPAIKESAVKQYQRQGFEREVALTMALVSSKYGAFFCQVFRNELRLFTEAHSEIRAAVEWLENYDPRLRKLAEDLDDQWLSRVAEIPE